MKTKQIYPIPGNGQIELFTDRDKNLTRVGFKSGYEIIKKYNVHENC